MSGEGSSAGITAFGRIAHGIGIRRATFDADERDRFLDGLLPSGDDLPVYLSRFLSLIALSAAIAGYGLLADSTAVVIGAMLVAPLMTPILATAASICTSDGHRLVRALLVLLGGTVLAIAVGYGTSISSGNTIVSATALPDEVLSRTSPTLLDLAIAIAAGAAAGYVAPRRDAISALPGVGIAVALVPPLAVVGIALEAGATREASGALLLYLTNLAAIIFAGAIVLLLSGIDPPDRSSLQRVRSGLLVTLGAVAAVAVPLTLHTVELLRDTRFERAVVASIREWDETVDVVDLTTDVDDGRGVVDLRVASPGQSRPAWELVRIIGERHEGAVDLRLSVEQTVDVEVSSR